MKNSNKLLCKPCESRCDGIENRYRLDIHNSTKHKHIHFVVNRIDISGKCTVKAHRYRRRFGEAVREVCKEKGLLTDIEIGIQKKLKC